MAHLHVERLGGLAGFGGAGGHVRSHGQVELSSLSTADQHAVEKLFRPQEKVTESQVRDGFRYRITRVTSAGKETVEAAEAEIPAVLAQCVKDELV